MEMVFSLAREFGPQFMVGCITGVTLWRTRALEKHVYNGLTHALQETREDVAYIKGKHSAED